MKKIITFLLLCLFLGALVALNKSGPNPQLLNHPIHHDDEFGGAYIDISMEDFGKLGFNFGDSLDLDFITSGRHCTFTDIGYFSGYYVPAGQMLVVGYKGYPNIKFCINYGTDIYAESGFDTNTLCSIKVNAAGKYREIEETLSISYSDDRGKYDSDEQFANFRCVTVGSIQSNLLYRGASPVDNSRSRAAIVDALLATNAIAYDIDLSDKEDAVAKGGKYLVGDTFKFLWDSERVSFLGMSAAYKSEDFGNKMRQLCLDIIASDGPCYIHCLEGKDRTGFVCMVLEALCDATYEEMIDDYFITYKNYYGIEKGSEKYAVIKRLHIDEMIAFVNGFEGRVNGYLLSIGLAQNQIDSLKMKLRGK